MDGCRLAVDIGGTFTDVVLQTPSGFTSGKVLTTSHAPEEGVILGIALVLGKAGLKPSDVELIIHGTTLATNAIIERRGARTALIAIRLRPPLRPVRSGNDAPAAARAAPVAARGAGARRG